jgi:hypothetical protein
MTRVVTTVLVVFVCGSWALAQPAAAPTPPTAPTLPTAPTPPTQATPSATGQVLTQPLTKLSFTCDAPTQPQTGCQPNCRSGCCEPCGPDECGWVSAELLLWFAKSAPTPPLVTASPAGTARADAGVLGVPGTTTLFGGQNINGELRPGFRLRAGVWLDECRRCGLEGNFLFLGNNSENVTFGSLDGSAIVGRPFFNALTGRPDAQLVSFPGVLSGTVNVDSSFNFFAGGVGYRHNLCCSACVPTDCSGCMPGYRIDLIGGYVPVRLTEDLNITENLTALDGTTGVPRGTNIIVRDRFRTVNEFHGGQVGLAGEVRRGCCFVDWRTSVALGNLRREVTIGGDTTVAVPGQLPVVRPGGLLTQPSNIGTYTSNVFAVLPEVSFNIGYELYPGLRLFAGYTFLYLNNVYRPGDQVDTTVNPTYLTGVPVADPARPAFLGRSSDFFVQGVSLGMSLHY